MYGRDLSNGGLAPSVPSNLVAGIEGLSISAKPLTKRHVTLADPDNLYTIDQFLGRVISQELARGDHTPERPIVFLFGEEHTKPSHKMAQICGLGHLVEHRERTGQNFLCAYEQSYNLLFQYADIVYARDLMQKLQHRLPEYDPDYICAIKAIVGRNQFDEAPLSMNRQFGYLLHHDIQTIFSDAAHTKNSIDPHDPLYKSTIEWLRSHGDLNVKMKWFNLFERSFHSESSKGIAIRNRIMVDRALTEAKRQKIGIVFQHCGRRHVFYNYRHSLAAMYRQTGLHVVPVVFDARKNAWHQDFINESEAWKPHPNSVVLDGLNKAKCYYNTPGAENATISKLVTSYRAHANGARVCPFENEPPAITYDDGLGAILRVVAAAQKSIPA